MTKYFLILREVTESDPGTIADNRQKDFILGISPALYHYLREKAERAIKAQDDYDRAVIFNDELQAPSTEN
jgi:hypothetical protein